MLQKVSVLDRVTAKLVGHHGLGQEDVAAIAAMPFELRTYGASNHLVREGERPWRCAFLMEGSAYRQKLTADGRRAIVSIQLPGDFVDLQNLHLKESDHDVQALTEVVAAEFAIADLRDLARRHPAIATAMWIDALVEASIFREWLLNVCRRDARARVAHLLCEFAVRLRATGLSAEPIYAFPMTQDQLGGTLGLTAVHINRVLKGLERDGLIHRDRRKVTITAWAALRHAADFNERYLHFDQAAA